MSTFPLQGTFECISPDEETALLNRIQELLPSLQSAGETVCRIQQSHGATIVVVNADATDRDEAIAFWEAIVSAAVEHAAIENRSSAWLRERDAEGAIVQDLRGWGGAG